MVVGTLFAVSTRLLSPLLCFANSLEYCGHVPEGTGAAETSTLQKGSLWRQFTLILLLQALVHCLQIPAPVETVLDTGGLASAWNCYLRALGTATTACTNNIYGHCCHTTSPIISFAEKKVLHVCPKSKKVHLLSWDMIIKYPQISQPIFKIQSIIQIFWAHPCFVQAVIVPLKLSISKITGPPTPGYLALFDSTDTWAPPNNVKTQSSVRVVIRLAKVTFS